MKLICVTFFLAVVCAEIPIDILSEEYADFLRSQNLPWEVGRNFDPSTELADIKRLLGVKADNHLRPKLPVRTHTRLSRGMDMTIPAAFDARKEWPNCTSIGTIRDQSSCGSCWAFAAVEAMSDRIIESGQKNQTQLSAADLLSCCEKCGDGCDGGYPATAWEFWNKKGIVSEKCQPYPFESCNHHIYNPNQKNCSELTPYTTPNCTSECDNSSLTFASEHTYGGEPYSISSVEEDIQMEIMMYGPVEASFDVFSDFLHYKSGIYKRAENATAVGGHAVKIIGWGVENKTNITYWLIANSWNEEWGEKGFFRMVRGENNCGIESNIVAGMPRSTQSGSSRLTSFSLIHQLIFSAVALILMRVSKSD